MTEQTEFRSILIYTNTDGITVCRTFRAENFDAAVLYGEQMHNEPEVFNIPAECADSMITLVYDVDHERFRYGQTKDASWGM